MVKRSDLGPLGSSLGEGAVGAVYRTTFSLPSYQGALAYKEILATIPSDVQRQALEDMRRVVSLRQALAPSDRARLDEYAAWPLEMVTDAGHDVGCLMPLIPPQFFAHVQPQGGRAEDIPRNIEFLSGTENLCRIAGFSQSEIDEFSERVTISAVLAKLVYVIGLLHKHGMVYGDISLKNAVFALNPPRVMLLDCDSVAPLSDPNRRHMNSPFFDAPEFKRPGTHAFARGKPHLQDKRTDVYKLACLIVRGLSRGPGATQLTNANHLRGVLDSVTFFALQKALGDDPDGRPTAKELYSALAGFVRSKSLPPVIRAFYPLTTVVPRGNDIVFVWDVDNAFTARLRGPNGFSQEVTPSWGRYTIPATHSGKYSLEVGRKGYIVSQDSELIQVFEVPEFDITNSRLPMPQIPSLAPVEVNSILQSLPVRPAVEIGTDFIPALGTPSAEPVLRRIAQATGGEVLSLELVNRAVQTFVPPPMSEVVNLETVTSRLTAGTGVVRDALADAQTQVQGILRDAADGIVRRHIPAIEAQVTAKVNAMYP